MYFVSENSRYMTKKIIIGLTGGIGCGKTSVLKMFETLGATTINADNINKELLKQTENIEQIRSKFGDKVFSNNLIDKDSLRTICFNNVNNKQWLENLLHPQIFNTIKQKINKPTNTYYIVEIPLLFETQPPINFSKTCVITSSHHQQLTRTYKKRGLTYAETNAIIKNQFNNKKKIKLADDWIDNSKTIEILYKQATLLHSLYLNLADKSLYA